MKVNMSLVAEAVDQGWSRNELFRLCIVEYPRQFHSSSPTEYRRLVEHGPRLTNTVWDAVIGASIEHVCLTHGCRPPAWTDEPERFRSGPEVLLWQWTETVLCHLPAPFTRRGIVFDARDLDARGGDEPWRPEIGDSDDRWPRGPGPVLGEKKSGDGRGRLEEACLGVESEALRSGWAVRVAMAGGSIPAKAFALRGRNAVDSRIVALDETRTQELIRRGLGHAGIEEEEWQELIHRRQSIAMNSVPAATVWNRPALTVAGTAPGILARWEAACPPKR
jgi:hypothetical protein